MAIIGDKNNGYTLQCDICDNQEDRLFYEFGDAVLFKQTNLNGWRSQKNNGVWEDVCPRCEAIKDENMLFSI